MNAITQSPTPAPTDEPSSDSMIIPGLLIGAAVLVLAMLYAFCVRNRNSSAAKDPLLPDEQV